MIKPKLLLHVCCAPCASSVVERLLKEDEYSITLYFSNSNIMPKEEYDHRLAELKRLVSEVYPSVNLIVDDYNPQDFFTAIKGQESLGEGSLRCASCIKQRLARTAQFACKNGYDCFATTLTVSPHKNAELINEIGYNLQTEYGTEYLPSNFKKQNGYLRSLELCREYNIYRQNYCGCGLEPK